MNNKKNYINYDIVIIGAGIAGLSAGIKLKQLFIKNNISMSICILEKGKYIGSHIISGAIINPKIFKKLFKNIKKKKIPLDSKVLEEKFLFLTENKSYNIPLFFVPKCLKNINNYMVSMYKIVKWLNKEAIKLNIDIFTGFSITKILYNKKNIVKGVKTSKLGVDKKYKNTSNFKDGIKIFAKYTLLAEGARGYLGKKIIKKYNLSKDKDVQNYAIGIKELWRVKNNEYKKGLILHTIGWPLKTNCSGGSFIYHFKNNIISIGYIIHLSYKDPYLSPFEEFQKYKTHPEIKKFLYLGKRISFGARVINLGGLQSLPKFIFPGGALLGCNAGFLNSSKMKGNCTSIKSSLLISKILFKIILNNNQNINIYKIFKKSSLYKELYKSRNFNFFMKKSLLFRLILIFIDQKIFKGYLPFTFYQKKLDHEYTEESNKHKFINYPKSDNILTFDKQSSVYLSNTKHIKNQPIHLKIKNNKIPININYKKYAGLEQRYCPANVYEFIKNKNKDIILNINSENCLHCKCCDIKDPKQNIKWTPPEGKGGPNYFNM